MKFFFTLLASLFLVTTTAMATTSTRIDLSGGTIPPGGRFSVKLVPLFDSAKYKIQCNLNSPDKSIVHISAMGVFAYDYVRAILNNQDIGSIAVGANGIINLGDNELVLPEFTITVGSSKTASIDFLNFDKDIAINITSCTAEPSV